MEYRQTVIYQSLHVKQVNGFISTDSSSEPKSYCRGPILGEIEIRRCDRVCDDAESPAVQNVKSNIENKELLNNNSNGSQIREESCCPICLAHFRVSDIVAV
jgi:hypothetical protein